jgi:hypothetical protein
MLALIAPAYGQNGSMTFKELLYSNTIPLTLKLKDLNSEWRRMSVSGQYDLGSMGGFMGMFGGGIGGTTYYTKGESVIIGSETYIVAYKANLKQPDFLSLMMENESNGGKEPDMSKMMPEKLTPESALSLSLLNLKTSGNLTDIRPFDVDREIADSGHSSNGLMDLMMLGTLSDAKKTKTAPAPSTTTKKTTKKL